MTVPASSEQPSPKPTGAAAASGGGPPPVKPKSGAADADGKYRVGTLAYTKAGLFVLFGWLLWGDFCFTLFEKVGGPDIIPLYLQDNFHISNLQVNIMFSVIPMIIGIIMTPVLSFKSDRHRGRWGRRIPFMLFTAPFLCFFAAGLGFSDVIMAGLKDHLGPDSFITPFTAGIVIIGFMLVGYCFFNEFVGTVYWYLFADVVPQRLMGRFLGLFRVVGTTAGFFANITIAAHQLTHMLWLHVGVAVLYFFGFGLMCWRVKEGDYPPVTDVTEKTTFWEQVRIYFRECFAHPVYILLYVYSLTFAAGRCAAPAGVFGLHLGQHRDMVSAHEGTAGACGLSADGKLAISAGEDGLVKLWSCPDGKRLQLRATLSGHAGPVRCAALAPSGALAASGGADGRIIVWDTAGGQSRQNWQAHPEVRALALFNDGHRLLSAGSDGLLKLWDTANGQCIRTFEGHSGAVNAVALTADETRAVSGGSDMKIIVWDLKDGTRLKTLEGSPGPVCCVAVTPGLEKASPAASQQAFGARWIEKATAYVREVFSNETLYAEKADERATLLGPDMWVVAGGRDGQTDELNSKVRLWSLSNGKLLQEWQGHKKAVFAIQYKPDLRMVLSGSADGTVRLWDPVNISPTAGDQALRTFSGYTDDVTSFSAVPDGAALLNASTVGRLHLWDIDQGVSLRKAGYMAAFFAIFSVLLAYPLGALVDRFHPIRIMLISCLLTVPLQFAAFFLVTDYRALVFIECFKVLLFALQGAAGIPMLISVFPKSSYGQMCSANALVRQFTQLVVGVLGSLFLDWLTQKSLLTDNFRYGYLWMSGGFVLSTLALLALYREWKRLGGDEHYVPPEVSPHAPA